MAEIELNSKPQSKEEKPLAIESGSIIFSQGHPSKFLYLLKKGEVRLIKEDNDRLTVVKNCIAPDILNEVSVLTKKPLEFSAYARSEVEVVIIDQKNIITVLSQGPGWILEIMNTLCERLNSTQDMILEHNLQASDLDPELKIPKEEEARIQKAIAAFKSR